jgi:hypothetical protein
MTHYRKLHILNGQEMYRYFTKTQFLENEMKIPFNEAMCYGNTSKDIFSNVFAEIRSKVHHVTTEKYAEVTLQPLQQLFDNEFERIELWFDADMFCQINYLTLLAYLDRKNHQNTIKLHIVDDKYDQIENYTLQTQGYDELYKQVLLHKTNPESINPPPLKKGIERYLIYLKEDSDIMQFIQQNQHLQDDELTAKLLENFKEYGLGDLQYLDMIKKSRLSQQQ